MVRLGSRRLFGKSLGLIEAMNEIASILFFAVMLLMTGDVFGRILGHPIMGTAEIVRVSIVAMLFMQLPHTFWSGRHLRTQILTKRMGPTMQAIFESIAWLFGILFFLSILMGGWGDMVTAWRINEIEGEGSVYVPVAPVRSIIIGSSALTLLVCLFKFVLNAYRIIRSYSRRLHGLPIDE